LSNVLTHIKLPWLEKPNGMAIFHHGNWQHHCKSKKWHISKCVSFQCLDSTVNLWIALVKASILLSVDHFCFWHAISTGKTSSRTSSLAIVTVITVTVSSVLLLSVLVLSLLWMWLLSTVDHFCCWWDANCVWFYQTMHYFVQWNVMYHKNIFDCMYCIHREYM